MPPESSQSAPSPESSRAECPTHSAQNRTPHSTAAPPGDSPSSANRNKDHSPCAATPSRCEKSKAQSQKATPKSASPPPKNASRPDAIPAVLPPAWPAFLPADIFFPPDSRNGLFLESLPAGCTGLRDCCSR